MSREDKRLTEKTDTEKAGSWKSRSTIREVAARAHVSTATVSYVLNGTRKISAPVSERVRRAALELHYYPNSAARSLRTDVRHVIGVVIPNLDNRFYSKFMKILEKELLKLGYTLVICCSQNDLEIEKKQIDNLCAWGVEAVVLAVASEQNDYSATVEATGRPFVFMDRYPAGWESFHGIYCNMHDVVQNVVGDLIDAGHERIVCLLPEIDMTPVKKRYQGYVDAFAVRGKKPDEKNVCISGSAIGARTGYNMTEYAVKALHASAVVALNRNLSLGVMEYVGTHGIRYPEELAIVGFGVYDWYRVCRPKLSTIVEPLENAGQAITSLLASLLKNPSQPPRQIELQGYLTDRTSF